MTESKPLERAQHRRGWRDPLLHYAILGAVTFGAYRLYATWVDAPPEADDAHTILVGPQTVNALAEQFERELGRPWTEDERETAIDAWIDDEILFRHGLELGLDEGDTVVRRRMIQHMRFVLESERPVADPTDEQLEAFFQANADRYRTDASIDFEEIVFDAAQVDGNDPQLAAATALASLESGAAPTDQSGRYGRAERITGTQASQIRGPAYAQWLAQLPLGAWTTYTQEGTYVLARVTKREASGQLPALAEVRPRVIADWTERRRSEQTADALESLREQYVVEYD